MGRYLVLYDLSGIQRFIFQTNRLKEIAGASYLVSRALFENVPELAGEGPSAWRTRDVSAFAGLGEDDAVPVYIGGGNALVLFGSEGRATAFTRELKRKVFLQTGGALRICSAGVEVTPDMRLGDCLDPTREDGLRARLDRSKAKAPQALPARGISVDQLDSDSFEPVLYFEKPIYVKGEKTSFQTRASRLKLEEYGSRHGGRAERSDATPILRLIQERTFEDEMDKFFAEAGTRNPGKHFLAVVHIDGNTMGQRIMAFGNATRKKPQALERDLADMRDLSAYIGECYGDALREMILRAYGEPTGETLPFRPVVADGDDITFICRSEGALECVALFVEALHHPAGGEPERKGLPRPSELSVGAGVAFVGDSYPFSSAYEVAEGLCKSAKGSALERVRQRVIEFDGDWDSDAQPPVSSVDFHVCSGELVEDVAGFRSRHLSWADPDEGEVSLCMRPYHIGTRAAAGEPDLSLEGFLRTLGDLQEHSEGETPWIARGKLKGLRDRYGEGVGRARRYGRTIVARNFAMARGGTASGAGRGAFVSGFGEPFVATAAGGCLYARYFDALDVMDICEGTRRMAASHDGQEGGAA